MENDDALDDDRLFELLASPRRRLLLVNLSDHDGPRLLRELAREIAVHETGEDAGAVDSDDVTRVYVALYQTHVPELEDHGLVRYDKSDRVVHLRRRGAEAAAMLRNWPDDSGGLAIPYVAAATVLGVVLLGREFGLLPVPGHVMSALTLAAVGALLALAVIHYVRTAGIEHAGLGLPSWVD